MKYLSVTKSLWALINNEDDFKLFICLKSQVSKNERFPHSLNEHFHFQFLFRNMVQNFLVLAGKEEAATKIYCWIFLRTMVAWLFSWHFTFSYIWIIKVSQCDQGSGIRQNIHNTELNVYVFTKNYLCFPQTKPPWYGKCLCVHHHFSSATHNPGGLRNSPPLATSQPWACPLKLGALHPVCFSIVHCRPPPLNCSFHTAPHIRRILRGLWVLYHTNISTRTWVTHIPVFCSGVTGPLHGKLQPESWFKEPHGYPRAILMPPFSLSHSICSVIILCISFPVLFSLPHG